jgi:hypothetical protein
MPQQPLPGVRATARLVAMTLLATVVLVMTLLLGQLVARPDPPAPPAPQGPVTPPLRLGPSAGGGPRDRSERRAGGLPDPPRPGHHPPPRYTLNRTCSTSPSWTTYDLDSVRRRPWERAASQPPAATTSS